MRKKKTASHNRGHHKTSSPKQMGLIVKENKLQQSARTKSTLDNHFHRTTLSTSFLSVGPGFEPQSGHSSKYIRLNKFSISQAALRSGLSRDGTPNGPQPQ